MAFIPVPETWQVTMRFTGSGVRPKVMGFYVKDSLADNSVTRASLLCSEVAGWASAELTPLYGAGLTLSNIEARYLETQNDTVYNLGTTIPGTDVAAGLPGNVTIAVSFRTGKAGKSFRGRVYHVGITEPNVSGNTVTTTLGNALIAAWEDLDSQLLALDFERVVVSRYANKAPRVMGLTTRITNYMLTDLNVDTQRRRVRPL